MASKRRASGSSKKILTKEVVTTENSTEEIIFSDDEEDFPLSSNEDIERIQKYETTTEIVAYVDATELPKLVKGGKRIFKFFANNGAGHRIQVIAWNEEIERIQYHVKLNHIIHVDGAMAVPSNEGFRVGTLPFELTIRSNTKINNYGPRKYEEERDASTMQMTPLSGVLDTTDPIKIQGYVKTTFDWVKKYKADMDEFAAGSITDGEFKLEIRITNFSTVDNSLYDFDKGEEVEIVGRIQKITQPAYMIVSSLRDVRKLNEPKMSLKRLLSGTAPLEHKNVQENKDIPETSNKIKRM